MGAGIPILVGTTGLGERQFQAIEQAARAVAVLQTGNTSLGVTLLAHLVREAAARLADGWDIEVLEMHHRGKVDAPSGTALLLGEAAAQARGVTLGEASERGRDGHTGPREPGAIGFASLRGGTVVGEHSVILAGEQERLVLSHVAESRMIFAHGAVRGAAWLIGRPAGRYAMAEVLGLLASHPRAGTPAELAIDPGASSSAGPAIPPHPDPDPESGTDPDARTSPDPGTGHNPGAAPRDPQA